MSMLIILIPVSLALLGVAVWAFIWAVNAGQFDDLETPGWDVLTDQVTDTRHVDHGG
jgi:cbb3-type cytochrome oxidase maturation protein